MTKIPTAKTALITPTTTVIIAISTVVSPLLSDGTPGDINTDDGDEEGNIATMSTTMNPALANSASWSYKTIELESSFLLTFF